MGDKTHKLIWSFSSWCGWSECFFLKDRLQKCRLEIFHSIQDARWFAKDSVEKGSTAQVFIFLSFLFLSLPAYQTEGT